MLFGGFRELLQSAQVALPNRAQQGLGDDRAERSAHPPWEPQPLVPRETGAATAAPAQREAPAAGDDAPMLDAHRPARHPFGHDHAIRRSQWTDRGDAVEHRARAPPLPADERDRAGVGHPIHVVLDAFEVSPQPCRRNVDRRANPDPHSASRNAAAATSGATVLTDSPVASSKPAVTVRRGVTRTYQW